MEIMFDIETLDTRSSAVVLSLGAVVFERDGTIVDRFYRVLSLKEQFSVGRTVSEDTMLWWMRQSADARAEAFAPVRVPVALALAAFYDFATTKQDRHEEGPGISKFWCNGPSFDGAIMESLSPLFGVQVPWAYNQLRDQRTLVDAAGFRIADHHPDIVGVPHMPVYDCEFQVSVVTACREKMAKRQNTP